MPWMVWHVLIRPALHLAAASPPCSQVQQRGLYDKDPTSGAIGELTILGNGDVSLSSLAGPVSRKRLVRRGSPRNTWPGREAPRQLSLFWQGRERRADPGRWSVPGRL